jgi:hypothetical protein
MLARLLFAVQALDKKLFIRGKPDRGFSSYVFFRRFVMIPEISWTQIQNWAGTTSLAQIIVKIWRLGGEPWREFARRMVARTGKKSARVSVGDTGVNNATLDLVNRSGDQGWDTLAKAYWFVENYPSQTRDEIWRMITFQGHGADRRTYDQFLPEYNHVGNYPAGSGFFNSIYERTSRGDGREAFYPDQGLVPDYGPPMQPHSAVPAIAAVLTPPVIITATLSIAGLAGLIVIVCIDHSNKAITLDATVELAGLGVDVDTTGSTVNYGVSEQGVNVGQTGGGISTSRSSTATTTQNNTSGAGASSIRGRGRLGGVEPWQSTASSGSRNTTTDTTTDTPPTGAAVPIGIGALAYFLL